MVRFKDRAGMRHIMMKKMVDTGNTFGDQKLKVLTQASHAIFLSVGHIGTAIFTLLKKLLYNKLYNIYNI